MEKFEIDEEKRLNVFSNFAGKVKDALITLIDDSKNNIKKYEKAIESTTDEIKETEASKEKCENEIAKMDERIKTIIDNIDNVESTYKKIVDAYSETSKGDTKELYSDIIDDAKANCENNVERNKMEIDRLRSDIESIKNNISEFESVIKELNKDLEDYNLELKKFNNVTNYLEKYREKANLDLDNISSNLIETKQVEIKRPEHKREIIKKSAPIVQPKKEVEEKPAPVVEKEIKPDISSINKVKEEVKVDMPKVEEKKVLPKSSDVVTKTNVSFEDSLKQIYDLTGYKPKSEDKVKTVLKEEPKVDLKKEEIKPVIDDDIFKMDKKEEDVSKYDESDMSEWEKILNGAEDSFTTVNPNKPVVEEKKEEKKETNDTVNQLLKPYGTTYENLTSLVGNHIQYKDGNVLSFRMSEQDIIDAINLIDGTDLKQMKTVGPEITLLRRVKQLKEGRN